MTQAEITALRDRRRAFARALYATGKTLRAIAAELGVSHTTVLADLSKPGPSVEEMEASFAKGKLGETEGA